MSEIILLNKNKIKICMKEEILRRNCSNYYYKNKNEISKKRKEIITCDCGKEVTYGSLWKHRRTKFHIDFFKRGEKFPPQNYRDYEF